MEYQNTDDTIRIDEYIEPGKNVESGHILQACYRIIDAEKVALAETKLPQAIRYQEQLKKYKQQLDPEMCKEVTNYKREKFAELEQSKEQIYEKVKSWNNQMKGMYKIKHVGKRKETMEAISEVQNVNKNQQENSQEETITI